MLFYHAKSGPGGGTFGHIWSHLDASWAQSWPQEHNKSLPSLLYYCIAFLVAVAVEWQAQCPRRDQWRQVRHLPTHSFTIVTGSTIILGRTGEHVDYCNIPVSTLNII